MFVYRTLTNGGREMSGFSGPAANGSPQSNRFEALDSLRGLCACMVVFFHLKTTGWITNSGMALHGWMFVDFFFVLSGFVIANSYFERLQQGHSVTKFMLLRLCRIYPLHLALLSLFLVMELAGYIFGSAGSSARIAFAHPRSVPELVASLSLTHIFFQFPSLVWNGPSWSIAAEVWTYLLMAASVRFFPRYAIMFIACAAAFSASLMLLAGSDAWVPGSGYDLARCVFGFSVGALGWKAHRKIGAFRPSFIVATSIEIAVAALCLLAVHTAAAPILSPAIFLVAVLTFSMERGALSRALCLQWPQALGAWSYSIYLLHTLLLGRALDLLSVAGARLHLPLVHTRFTGTGTMRVVTLAPDVVALGLLAGIVACAAFSYHNFELPANEWLRSRLRSSSKAKKKGEMQHTSTRPLLPITPENLQTADTVA